MQKVYFLVIALFLCAVAAAQKLTPSTIGQVFNFSAGDSFEYSFSVEPTYPEPNPPYADFSGKALVVIDSVVQRHDSAFYFGTTQEGATGYNVSFLPLFFSGFNYNYVQRGSDSLLFTITSPDSSIFLIYPLDTSGDIMSLTDSSFTDTAYYHNREQNLCNIYFFEAAFNERYSDSIGLVHHFDQYKQGLATNIDLDYYHKGSGDRWGMYTGIISGVDNLQSPVPAARLYPNPVMDQFTLYVPQVTQQDIVLQVFDMDGREVLRSAIASPITLFNRGALPTGTYVWQLSAAGQVQDRGLMVFK